MHWINKIWINNYFELFHITNPVFYLCENFPKQSEDSDFHSRLVPDENISFVKSAWLHYTKDPHYALIVRVMSR